MDFGFDINSIENVYLFFGSETYKRRLYKDNLKKCLGASGNDINYSYFEGTHINFEDVYDASVQLPFFAEKRLVIVENSGIFKAARSKDGAGGAEEKSHGKDALAEKLINELPQTTCLAFFEESAAKNKKIYKLVSSKGKVIECNADSRDDVAVWIAKGFASYGKKIKKSTALMIADRVGLDYDRLRLEIAKTAGYLGDEDIVTSEAVLAVVSEEPENKIFEMIDAAAGRDVKGALDKYYGLLALKEPPLKILAMIRAQMRTLMQADEYIRDGYSDREIAKKIKGSERFEWLAARYRKTAAGFKQYETENIISRIAEADASIKCGEADGQIAVEMLIIGIAAGYGGHVGR